tara:strand:+ start:49 stop:552 length:504 start_codon:yes stop_codon:yes gene_type:complete
MNEPNEKISKVLNTTFEESVDKSSKEIVSTDKIKNEVVKNKKEIKDLTKTDAEQDYDKIRKNLYGLMGDGQNAIDGILKVATEGDSPRAYEVVAQLLKTVSEINKDLMDLHKQVKEVNKEENVYNNTTTNAIYVGSTSDLQDLINPDRSRVKKVIDVDHEVKKANDG